MDVHNQTNYIINKLANLNDDQLYGIKTCMNNVNDVNDNIYIKVCILNPPYHSYICSINHQLKLLNIQDLVLTIIVFSSRNVQYKNILRQKIHNINMFPL